MPSSGELRLRTFTLALIALGGIWIALVIQRGHHAPAAACAAGPQPADFAAPKLVRVKGLNRPVAASPVANVSPRVKPFTRVLPKTMTAASSDVARESAVNPSSAWNDAKRTSTL